MFNNRRRQATEQVEALTAQRQREDSSPRLHVMFPNLTSMRLRFEDRRTDGRSVALPYTKHIVVSSAPAVFSVRCVEPRCNGRHELTGLVLRGLRTSLTRTEGESICQGSVGDVPCDRTLVFICEAEYRP